MAVVKSEPLITQMHASSTQYTSNITKPSPLRWPFAACWMGGWVGGWQTWRGSLDSTRLTSIQIEFSCEPFTSICASIHMAGRASHASSFPYYRLPSPPDESLMMQSRPAPNP